MAHRRDLRALARTTLLQCNMTYMQCSKPDVKGRETAKRAGTVKRIINPS